MTPAFEQFARSKGWSLLHKGETGEYRALNTQAGWLAWQAREVPQWISVTDELPPKNTEVLIWFRGCSIPATGQYTGSVHDQDGWCYPAENGGDDTDWTITHWMEAPAAPQQPAFLGGGV